MSGVWIKNPSPFPPAPPMVQQAVKAMLRIRIRRALAAGVDPEILKTNASADARQLVDEVLREVKST